MPKPKELEIIITGKDLVSKVVDGVNQHLKTIQTNVKSITGSLFNLKTAFASFITGATVKGLIDAADELERVQKALSMRGFGKTTLDAIEQIAPILGKRLPEISDIFLKATAGRFKQLLQLGITAEKTAGDHVKMTWVENGKQVTKIIKDSQDEISKLLISIWQSPAYLEGMKKYRYDWSVLMVGLHEMFESLSRTIMSGGLFNYLKAGIAVVLERFQMLKKDGSLDKWAKSFSDSIIKVVETLLTRSAAVLDMIAPIFRSVSGTFMTIMKGIDSMPGWMQEIGLIGIILGGKKGAMAMGLFALEFKRAEQFFLGLLAYRQGDFTFKEWSRLGPDQIEPYLRMRGLAGKYGLDAKQESAGGKGAISEWIKNYLADVKKTQDEITRLQNQRTMADKTGGGDVGNIEERLEANYRALEKSGRALMEKIQAGLDDAYETGLLSIKDYFAERIKIVTETYDREIEALKKLAAAEDNANKKKERNAEITAKQADKERELLKIRKDQREEERKLAQRQEETQAILNQLQNEAIDPGDITGKQKKEMDELVHKNNEALIKLKANKASEEQIKQAAADAETARQRLASKQELERYSGGLLVASTFTGNVTQMFSNMYELTGKKHKEYFMLYKATAIAQSLINTALAITRTLAELGAWGVPVSVAIGALGATQVALIASQQPAGYAAGGRIKGSSPSKTSDNIPIMATAGEFVFPVDTVRHYGAAVMEGLRRRMIPRELLAGYNFNIPNITPKTAFASGGMVSEAAAGGSANMTIINVLDPATVADALNSVEGEGVILNVLSRRGPAVKRVLGITG